MSLGPHEVLSPNEAVDSPITICVIEFNDGHRVVYGDPTTADYIILVDVSGSIRHVEQQVRGTRVHTNGLGHHTSAAIT